MWPGIHGPLGTASATASGARVAIDGGVTGRLFTSARYLSSGGSIDLLGSDLELVGVTADASASTGGGRIRVGGDFQGGKGLANPVVNAQTVEVDPNTMLRADASLSGMGGRVVVWADQTTNFAGSLSAKGGTRGGDGGQIEVSGKGDLNYADGAMPGRARAIEQPSAGSQKPHHRLRRGYPSYDLVNRAPSSGPLARSSCRWPTATW